MTRRRSDRHGRTELLNQGGVPDWERKPCDKCNATGVLGTECRPREDSLFCTVCNGRGWNQEPLGTLAVIRGAVAAGVSPHGLTADTLRARAPDWVVMFYNRLFVMVADVTDGVDILSGEIAQVRRPLCVTDDMSVLCFARACAWVAKAGDGPELLRRIDAYGAAVRMVGITTADRLTMGL